MQQHRGCQYHLLLLLLLLLGVCSQASLPGIR
jgi:hypothetical protein